ncbi:MAG: beta-ketoacyl synthase N-terminal-like domain-containing protein [Gemmatimonadota bacterium]
MSEGQQPQSLSPVKQALVEIRRLKRELEEARAPAREPIAVVGVGMRTPGGVDSLASFERMLFGATDAVSPIPDNRWDHEAFFAAGDARPGKYYVNAGGFLDEIDLFDPEFFGIAPLETRTMDPQQRLLLETTWRALEHAAISPASLRGSRTGVFVGIGTTDYQRMVLGDPNRIDTYASTGTAFSVASGRIAYLLGLEGPALTVDTACSSSLVAVHLACRSLRSGESDLALASGVSLIITPELTINFCQAGMLSPDGRCKTFDAAADGYVRSEGCGVVVLKRLSDARRAGDRILAVVRGSAINQDGRSSGLTAPSGPAQEEVLRSALDDAGLRSSDVGYVEAHGTGTPLGDPIEIGALGAIFSGERAHPLAVGSVKTNVGHMEAAAGITGLIKAISTVRSGRIAPHLHFGEPNPHIEWDALPIVIPTEEMPFPGTDTRRAGVSSFGFSGTNAHVVVEEAPASDERATTEERSANLLTLSAPLSGSRAELAHAFVAHLADSATPFEDSCRTANGGRPHLAHRVAVVAADAAAAQSALTHWLEDGDAPGVFASTDDEAERPEIGLVFPESTGVDVEAARALIRGSSVARRMFEACEEPTRQAFGVSIAELLSGSPDEAPELAPHALGLATQLALAALWKSWGVDTSVVLGYGTGEVVAAVSAAVLSLDDSIELVADLHATRRAIADGTPRAEAEAAFARTISGLGKAMPAGVAYRSGRTGQEVLDPSDARHWIGALDPTVPASEVWHAAYQDASCLLLLGDEERGASEAPAPAPRWLSPEITAGDPWPGLLAALAALYAAGADVDWDEVHAGSGADVVTLPGIPFARRRFWLESGADASSRATEGVGDPWGAAVRQANDRADFAPLDMRMDSFADRWRALEELTHTVGRNTLVELGAFDEAGVTLDVAGVLEATGIGELYRPIVSRWLDALVASGHLDRVDGGFRATERLQAFDAGPAWERVDSLLADDPALLRYVRHSGSLVTEVLSGKTSPLETLFPGGDFDLAGTLYEQAHVLRYVNAIAAGALEAYVRELPAGVPVRVLEIGAGTGGTTSSLLPVLPTERTRYDYTDVSDIFLDWGRKKFSDFPFLRTLRFDMDQDPAEQGVEVGGYDVIVGSNVIHAALDLDRALGTVRGLLAPGGLLLLVESTGHLAWHDITTGLIEGWQDFEDDLRGETPLLSPGRWLDLLQRAGFSETGAFPPEGSSAEVLKQHIILGAAPGVAGSTDADVTFEAEVRAETTEAAAPATTLPGGFAEADEKERKDIVTGIVRSAVIDVLNADPDRPPSRNARLMELGVDSLMAVRLRNLIQERAGLGDALPSTLIFDYPTIKLISALVLGTLEDAVGQSDAGPTDVTVPVDATTSADVAGLSEEEAAARLLRQLEALEGDA